MYDTQSIERALAARGAQPQGQPQGMNPAIAQMLDSMQMQAPPVAPAGPEMMQMPQAPGQDPNQILMMLMSMLNGQ